MEEPLGGPAGHPSREGTQGDTRAGPPPDTPQVLGRSPGRSTGVSGNFLLNFQTYKEGGRPTNAGAGNGRGPLPPRRGGARQPYDRDRFLQANFRYLVSDAIDVRRYEGDADLAIDWEDVVGLELLSTSGEAVCPITLDKLQSPVITPCGHIYSFHAILQHMMTHSPDFRSAVKCPVCETKIAARELRLVSIQPVTAPEPLQSVRLQLLHRPRGSIVPVEVGAPAVDIPEPAMSGQQPGGEASKAAGRPWVAGSAGRGDSARGSGQSAPSCSRFSKFTLISDPSPLWVAEGRRLAGHAAQIMAEGGIHSDYEAQFVFAAMDALATRARVWAERRQRQLLERADSGQLSRLSSPEDAGQAAFDAVKQVTSAVAEAKEVALASAALARDFPALRPAKPDSAPNPAPAEPAEAGSSGAAEPSDPGPEAAGSSGRPDAASATDSEYYFYQLADGQKGFLCPQNLRMLLHAYGSYTALPLALTAKVLEIEKVVQTAAARKRLKVLSHLPLNGEFMLLEVDLEGILSAEAMAPFTEELAQRQRKRAQRAKREAQQLRREAASALAAKAAAETGLSAAELRAMPRPGAPLAPEDLFEEEAVEEGGAESPPAPQDGVSFARIAALGFAATGPSLSAAAGGDQAPPAAAYPSLGASQPRAAQGAWGRPAATTVQARSAAPPLPQPDPSKKGSKKGTLLFSTSNRRY